MFIAIDRSLGRVMDMFFEKVKTGDQGGKINQYLTLARVPELVVMGSSRAAHQIIPTVWVTGALIWVTMECTCLFKPAYYG